MDDHDCQLLTSLSAQLHSSLGLDLAWCSATGHTLATAGKPLLPPTPEELAHVAPDQEKTVGTTTVLCLPWQEQKLYLLLSAIIDGERQRIAQNWCRSFINALAEERATHRELTGHRIRLQDFAELASDWFWEMDAELRFSYFSERFQQSAHFNPSPIIGKSRQELVANEGLNEHWQQHLDDLAARREFRNFEYLARNLEDGSRRWFRISGRPVYDQDGQFVGYRGVGSDITHERQMFLALRQAKEQAECSVRELTQTQDSLVRAEKLASLGQLTAGVAHEIKNPLNFVINFANTSQTLIQELTALLTNHRQSMSADSWDEVEDLLQTLTSDLHTIIKHGQRADRIVKSMLLHAREDASCYEAVRLNQLAEEALKLAYHGARAVDSTLQVAILTELDPAVVEVTVIPQDITRALINLSNNALYAAHQRARQVTNPNFAAQVTLSTHALPQAVEIRVRDNGCGIPPAEQEKLFTPFFTTKPVGEGTGLGLSISYDIVVHRHGGSLEVVSEPNQHTTFIIRLPQRDSTTATP